MMFKVPLSPTDLWPNPMGLFTDLKGPATVLRLHCCWTISGSATRWMQWWLPAVVNPGCCQGKWAVQGQGEEEMGMSREGASRFGSRMFH